MEAEERAFLAEAGAGVAAPVSVNCFFLLEEGVETAAASAFLFFPPALFSSFAFSSRSMKNLVARENVPLPLPCHFPFIFMKRPKLLELT